MTTTTTNIFASATTFTPDRPKGQVLPDLLPMIAQSNIVEQATVEMMKIELRGYEAEDLKATLASVAPKGYKLEARKFKNQLRFSFEPIDTES